MNVASCTPTRDFMFFSAQRPNAWLPPDLLTSPTSIPKITRKQIIPPSSEIDDDKPLTTTTLKALTILKSAANRAPNKIPRKSEEYASFVSNAKPIAKNEGTNAQIVPYIIYVSPPYKIFLFIILTFFSMKIKKEKKFSFHNLI